VSGISYGEAHAECRRKGWPEDREHLRRAFERIGKRRANRARRRAREREQQRKFEREKAERPEIYE